MGDPILNFPAGINTRSKFIPLPRSAFSSTSFCKIFATTICTSFALASVNGATNRFPVTGIITDGSGLITVGAISAVLAKRNPTLSLREGDELKARLKELATHPLLRKDPPATHDIFP